MFKLHKELWENFRDIYFEEKTHTYTDSVGTKYRSATGFIHDYTIAPDWEKIRARKAEKQLKEEIQAKHPELSLEQIKLAPQLIEKRAGEIKEQWDKNGKYASTLGTAIHSVMENLWYKKNFDPDESIFEQYPEMREDFLFRKKFCKNDLFKKMRSIWVPIANEFIVYDQPNAVCGTIDMLAYNTRKNCFSILDWKTSKEFSESNKWQKMLPPFDSFDDCNMNHYSLQLSIYKWILERHTSIKIGEMLLFQIPKEGTMPQVGVCKDMTTFLDKIFR